MKSSHRGTEARSRGNLANSLCPCASVRDFWRFLSSFASSKQSVVALLALAGSFCAPPLLVVADDSDKLFKDSVRPLFKRKCFDCHSSKAEEVKGNLKLETLESVLKGGDQGPAIVAGDAENSFLVRAIRYEVEDFQMPPAGRLSDEDIALVEKWIKSLGANNK
jgi:mono/diheme cytochrome c family protein